MRQFLAHAGHFWLDGRPQLIHAAEFHYFRTPRVAWPQRLGLLRDAGFNTVATYIPWLWHQLAEGQTDVDGHSHPQRDLAGFLDLAAEMGFLLIARPGPYIMAETINEGIPPWLFARYPQTAFINQHGARENIASYLHPDFLTQVAGWYAAVFGVLTPRQITRSGQIIMLQLDNEAGMPHWVRNIFDRNPHTVQRLADWLRATYSDALAARYPAAAGGDLATWLDTALADAPAALVHDYRLFYRDYLRDYLRWLWDAARANGLEVPPVVNVHGFMRGGKTFPIGLSQLIKAIELPGMLSATDVYPLTIGEGTFHQLLFVNATTAALQNRDQPLFSIEFQSGGCQDFSNSQTSMYDLHSRLCLSSGMRAINHYLFTAGENDPVLSPVRRHDWGPPIRNDGSVRHHYWRYVRLSQTLNAYGEALVCAQPQTVTTLGFLLDDYMTEVGSAASKPADDVLTHQREVVLCDFIARGLALTHRPFDAVELARAALDPARTPSLWVMLDKHCPPAVQRKLVDYARAGGRLVLVGRLPEYAADDAPCTTLRDALGVTAVTSDAPFTWGQEIAAFDDPCVPVTLIESYSGDFDAVFARRGDAVVGFRRALGAGCVLLLGAALSVDTREDLAIITQLARAIDLPPLFTLSAWADVRISRGAAGDFLYVNNYLDDPIVTTIACAGVLLFDGAALHLPARRGVILPLEWQAADGVRLHYCTAELKAIATHADGLTLTFDPPDFVAALTLDGYVCADATPFADGRVRAARSDGMLLLRRA